MTARLREIWSNLIAIVAAQPAGRRLALVATSVGSLVLVLAVAWWAQHSDYRPLFTNLTEQDAAAIVETLRTDKVAYRLEDGGRAVLVPADRLYELRLRMASRGLPEGGGVGFEIFDKQTFGQTEFVQHLNYQRALQGELGRTVAQLGGVESARVHLAIPERSLFVSRDRAPSASVAVKLLRGRTLGQEQIDGIVHLVASSVQGLSPEGVTVVDETGRILSAQRREGALGSVSGSGLEYQRSVERLAEERIETMLGAVVGPGKVIARVSATVDVSRTEREEELYDPDRTALATSETTRAEGESAGPKSPAARGERLAERQTYQVSRTRSRTVVPVGAVTQLSVAVLVDGAYRDEAGTRVFVPRSDEEIGRLKALVVSAVGADDARGDRVEVTSAPFQGAEALVAPAVFDQVAVWVPAVLGRLTSVVLVVGVLLFVVRPLVRQLGAAPAPTRRAFRGLFLDRESAVSDLAQENVALAQQNPERAAQLVRQWLLESGQKSA
jgi:flagellar M-ring protein FliF